LKEYENKETKLFKEIETEKYLSEEKKKYSMKHKSISNTEKYLNNFFVDIKKLFEESQSIIKFSDILDQYNQNVK